MILFVKKFNLILELFYNFLIGFLMILQVQLVQILPALVELAESDDFVVSCLNLAFNLLKLLLEL